MVLLYYFPEIVSLFSPTTYLVGIFFLNHFVVCALKLHCGIDSCVSASVIMAG